MSLKYIEKSNFEDTGFSYTMSLISGKHKMVILYCLMEFEPVRFNEMKRYLGNITGCGTFAAPGERFRERPAAKGY